MRFAERFKVESSRLIGWNYSESGYYFVTICTRYHNNWLGKIVDGKIEYKEAGKICVAELLKTFELRKYLNLVAWVVMPNHVHILFSIRDIHVETRCNASQNTKNVENVKEELSLEVNISTTKQNVVLLKETRCNASLPGDSKETTVISNYRNHPEFFNKLNLKSNQEVPKLVRAFKCAVKREANKNKLFFVWQERYYDEIVKDERKLKTIIYYIKNNVKNWNKDYLFNSQIVKLRNEAKETQAR